MGTHNGPVFCPANQKTEVLWATLVVTEYQGTFSQPGVTIQWERNSADPPFHTWGSHDTSGPFGAWLTGAYTNFWFTSPVPLTVNFS